MSLTQEKISVGEVRKIIFFPFELHFSSLKDKKEHRKFSVNFQQHNLLIYMAFYFYEDVTETHTYTLYSVILTIPENGSYF